MKNKKRFGKLIASGLGICLTAGTICTPLQAKAPVVEVDESMYVNMDYYGDIDDISVVKGCFLNGNSVIEDYGRYDEIINMSNRATPVVEGDKITWNLDETEKQYFYYECKSEDFKAKVPWQIDVSYRLNGVEAKGEDLGGAEGMVTTLIHVTPNRDIADYYKSNMILLCGTVVDMKDTLSIEAPGAQLQTLGTEKAVIFLSLPGEESEYRIDIGTNDYSSMGVFFMMVPATLESLEIVNDIRDVRDTVEDSVDAMDSALDVILDNVSDMRDDLANVEEGLGKAEEAHQIYDSSRESMEADADAAISSLENMVTYLEIINTQTKADQANLDRTISRLADLMNSIGGMSKFGTDMTNNLNGLKGSLGNLKEISEGTITDEGIAVLESLVGSTGDKTQTVKGVAMQTAFQKIAEAQGMTPEQVKTIYETNGAPGHDTIKALVDAAVAQITAGLDTSASSPSGADIGLNLLLNSYMETLKGLNTGAGDSLSGTMGNTQELLSTAEGVMEQVNYMAGSAQDIQSWMNGTMREDIQTLITQLTDLISMTEMTLSATQAALSSIRSTMELTEETLSSSLTLTLNGLAGIMHSGVGMADGVDTMRNAKNTMKGAIDDELDELEEEHNFLDMDVTKEFPSFTSEKNPSPSSIQIIMRTAEISADEDADNVTDIEAPREDIGIWGRFKAVFINLGNTVKGWFH